MNLERKDYEAVRYQLKKEGYQNITNEEIRKACEGIETFNAIEIAVKVIENRDSKVTLSKPSLGLTVAQKHELVQIQAGFMGIELNTLEIEKIASSANNDITDNIEFLQEIRNIITEFLAVRNQQFQNHTSKIVNDIADVINAGEIELVQIVTDTNERLSEIVKQCQERKANYKSPYRDRLESIKESLGLSV
jgi:chemotaxis regulatin CheY-phosphate phosphatase CheZ